MKKKILPLTVLFCFGVLNFILFQNFSSVPNLTGGCGSDLNGSGFVNAQDSAILRNDIGVSYPNNPLSDINGNGFVNAQDNAILRNDLGRKINCTSINIPVEPMITMNAKSNEVIYVNLKSNDPNTSSFSIITPPSWVKVMLLNTKTGITRIDSNSMVGVDYFAYTDGTTTHTVNLEFSAVATQISLGVTSTCALFTTGGVKCWGGNLFGQLGNGTTNDSKYPVDVVGLNFKVKSIDVGDSHVCALLESGGVQCWGDNSHGQLGNGTFINTNVPSNVIGLSSGVKAISSGRFNSCALMDTGAIKCWGDNTHGQLGNSAFTNTRTLVPLDVLGLGSSANSISVGDNHMCALLTSGNIKCWGRNQNGELGAFTTGQFSNVPLEVLNIVNATSVSAGNSITCAIVMVGVTKCWGSNNYGSLGNGSTVNSTTPVNTFGLEGPTTAAISTGYFYSCALLNTSGVKCWGYNMYGQLGNGSQGSSLTPTSIFSLSTGVSSVSAGAYHTCAILKTGEVKCWGWNNSGQLGIGTTTQWYTPVRVIGI